MGKTNVFYYKKMFIIQYLGNEMIVILLYIYILDI